jgi:membrane-bound lytic murein transglycosylase D
MFANGCAHQMHADSAAKNLSPPQIATSTLTKETHSTGSSPISVYPSRLPREIGDTDQDLIPPGEDEDSLEFGVQNQNILDEALDFCQLSQDFWQKGENENALQALDTAYSLILKLNTYDRPRLIQQKEDIRHLISKRVIEIYSSRYVARGANHNSIPRIMNDHVKAEIYLMTQGAEKEFFANAYQRSGRYRQWIEEELAKEGLPVELAWLPLIESGYKSTAYSSARALGMWQFIASTGYRFGLTRDNYIDERMDPYKSTKGAIAYLKELHNLFGDWETVLAAYNCGEGKVMRTINTQSINYLDNFWDLYEKLPRETARYVPRFIATLHIVSNPEHYGLQDITPEPPIEFETTEIRGNIHLKSISEATGIPQPTLKLLNSELRWEITPGDTYPLKVPVGYSEILLSKLDEIPEISETPQEPEQPKTDSNSKTYIVKKGETLSGIADKHHISINLLAKMNKLKSTSHLKTGQSLVISQQASAPPAKTTVIAAKPVSKSSAVQPVSYEVKTGDNLFNIARRYNTTAKKIQEVNRLSSNNLTVGQSLQIPVDGKPASIQLAGLKKYQVKKGDNAFSIASRHKMPIDRFLSINNLTSSSKLMPGQKLYVE